MITIQKLQTDLKQKDSAVKKLEKNIEGFKDKMMEYQSEKINLEQEKKGAKIEVETNAIEQKQREFDMRT
jgi:predicted phage tail protein